MKKIFLIIMMLGIVIIFTSTGNTALTKRSFYDLFGETLNAQYWILSLIDRNTPTGAGAGSQLLGEGWGFFCDQVYKLNYSDKYKKIKTTFDIGFYYYVSGGTYWSTDLLDVKLSPYTFNKVWWPGMRATLSTPLHSGTLLFTRSSNMAVGATMRLNTYLLALRDVYKFTMGDIKLELGGTFLNHWRENGLMDDNSFVGNIDDSATTQIILRFSDDSPEDAYGTALYSLEYSADNAPFTPVVPYSETPEEANGPVTFVKSFDVPPTAKSVRVKMVLANDYKVEIANPSYIKIANAQGNPKDYQKKTIVYVYGLSTGNQFIGFDVKGTVYGVKVEMENTYNLKWRKNPIKEGERAFDLSPVFYLKADRKFGKFFVKGDVWYTDQDYTTIFKDNINPFTYVDDNDDGDWYDDVSGKASGINFATGGYRPLAPYWHLSYDRDSNKVLDWEQNMLLFSSDPARFWIGDDRNNNIIADQFEDDYYPDYPFKLNRKGYGIFAGYDLIEGVNLGVGYDDFGEVSTTNRTNNIYITSRYKTKISNFGDINLYHQIKKVQDNMDDDLATYTSQDDWSTYIGADPLDYRDSLLNVAYLESNYTGFKNLTVSNKFKFENNYQYNDLRSVRWAGFITNAKYVIQPSKIFTITPQWKLWLEKGFSIPDYLSYRLDRQLNAFLLRFDYKVFEKTTFSGGIQYKMVRFPLKSWADYNHVMFILQLVSRAGSYPLQLGYLRNLRNTPSAPDYTKEEYTFLAIYLTK